MFASQRYMSVLKGYKSMFFFHQFPKEENLRNFVFAFLSIAALPKCSQLI